MSLETDLYAVLGPLVGGRAYPDFAKIGATSPYITYFQAGGQAINFLESGLVGKRNARVQVNCWASTRIDANQLARDAEDAMVLSGLKTYVIGAFSVSSNSDLNLYGTRQDFSVWY
jgi:hypothetical protein